MNTETNLQKEIWKPIKELEDKYHVSNLGRVKILARKVKGKNGSIRNKGEFIAKQQTTHNGYKSVGLSTGYKKRKHFTIHRLVATTFMENKENKKQVNHINGIKTDNRLINLEWSTRSENMKHASKSGLFEKKEKRTRLKVESVIKIRKMYKEGVSQISLSKMFDVTSNNINHIVNRKSWQHI